jgi:hypothetical protein
MSEVICPACGDKGAATTCAKDKCIPYVLYYIRHEILNEKWAHGRAKERSCTKFTQEQRDEIVKQLGSYISTSKIIDKSESSQIQKRTSERSEIPVLQKQVPYTGKDYSATEDRFVQSLTTVRVRNKKLVTCKMQ